MQDDNYNDGSQQEEVVTPDEGAGPKCVSEFISRNQNYKAAVYDLQADPIKFEVAIYKWAEVKNEQPVWERIAGPIIMDSLPAAETWGQENLAVYSGEKLDNTVNDALRSEVYKILGHENYDFLDPHSFTVSFLESEESGEFLPIEQVDKVLAAGEFYFVEFKDTWLAGFLYDEGEIRCWKKFEDLKNALSEIV